MTIFVSRRTLPGIRIDLFAALFDGARHGIEIGWIDGTSEAQEILARCSDGFGQAAREIQHLALVRAIEPVDLLDNFVFDGLLHDEMNVGKGILNVKCAATVVLLRAQILRMLTLVAEAEKILIVDIHQAAKSTNFRELGMSERPNFWLQKTITQNLESKTEFVAC